ncbi:MAG TPA: type IV pilin N-terminal domain-containing protein [Methanoregulaceae archaeon]|nr:type IV pilin N-terminal domain-containing protein [Methanolinea sp.]MDD5047729.1 type IV pilin N-terminal domain-containing protein [Methanoregulaceae archaeon]HQA81502.1 type IV pilin N-terminal domain-containing protein [Methanoregulaceae archaeon]
MKPISSRQATSPVIAEILMIGIVMILAIVVLLMIFVPSFSFFEPEAPSTLQIMGVYHQNEYGYLNYDSRVILVNKGEDRYVNGELHATFYKNDVKVPCTIETMNGNEFISTHHYGVQTIGGSGCRGEFWNPNEKIAIDFSDFTFRPGDEIKMEIFRKPSNSLISRHSYTA